MPAWHSTKRFWVLLLSLLAWSADAKKVYSGQSILRQPHDHTSDRPSAPVGSSVTPAPWTPQPTSWNMSTLVHAITSSLFLSAEKKVEQPAPWTAKPTSWNMSTLAHAITSSLFPPVEKKVEQPLVCKIPLGSKLSGLGQAGDNYYHFLVDYAVKMFSYCYQPGKKSIMYARKDEGYLAGNPRWALSLFAPGKMNSKAFDFIFDGNLELRHVTDRELKDIKGVSVPFQKWQGCKETDAKSFVMLDNECSEWSRQPVQNFKAFRKYMVEKAFAASKETNLVADEIILLERSKKSTQRIGNGRVIHDRMRKLVNSVAARLGLKVKSVEILQGTPIDEQVRQFARAKVVIGNHGAALSNLMFCPTGAQVLEIQPVTFPCFSNLAKRLGLKYRATNQAMVTEQELESILSQKDILSGWYSL